MKTAKVNCHGLVVLLLFCLAPALFAQQAPPVTASKHSLWKVQGKNSTVFLLGSIHLLKAEDYPLPAEMEAAFTNSTVAAFEADMDAMEKPETQMQLLSKASLPQGETLAQQLSPALYAKFTNHLKETGLPLELFSQLKPGLAAVTFAAVELLKLGFDPKYGVDKYYFERARKAGKQIVALETLDFQISMVTDFSKEEGELLLKVTLEEIDTTKKEIRALIKAWKTGDAAALESLLNEAFHQAPTIYKRLLTDRNRNWVPRIEEWLRGDKNAIVIVGAGHLVGEEGLVELLRKKGWKITQQ